MKLAVVVSDAFRKALANLAKQKIPLKTAFKIKGIIKRVDEEYAKYEECRKASLARFGKKDEEGNLLLDEHKSVRLGPNDIEGFIKELNELTSTDIEVQTISLSELGDGIQLSTEELLILEQIIEE
jgi:hypothetical protein